MLSLPPKGSIINSANKKRLFTNLGDLPTPRPVSDFSFYIISKGRPKNVKKMIALFKGTGGGIQLQPTVLITTHAPKVFDQTGLLARARQKHTAKAAPKKTR